MIPSFVRRKGRVSKAQKRALNDLWPYYGIEIDEVLDLEAVFGRPAKKHLEIGFGRGDALIAMAKAHPEYDYIGIDIYRPGIGYLLLQIEATELTNIRIICADAVEILQQYLPPHCLDAVYLFFPDPWQKKRHHKRRLIQAEFLKLLAQRLKSGAIFHLATDWENYAKQMFSELEAASDFINSIPAGGFAPRPQERPLTKFEQRGLRLGHGVWDLVYQRI
jgi:tRNA (guanine-N7-)-methyltransferase